MIVEQLRPSSRWAGTPIHITDGEPVNFQRFMADLVQPLGYRVKERIGIPAGLVDAIARGYEFRYRATGADRWARPPVTRHSLRLVTHDYYLDSSKLRTQLGYSPPIDRATAKANTQEWLTANFHQVGSDR